MNDKQKELFLYFKSLFGMLAIICLVLSISTLGIGVFLGIDTSFSFPIYGTMIFHASHEHTSYYLANIIKRENNES